MNGLPYILPVEVQDQVLQAIWRDTAKGKAIPLQALRGPEGSRRLRF